MTLIQAWPANSVGGGQGPSLSGPETTAGNTLFASVVGRSDTIASFVVTDDGGNTWTTVGIATAGSATTALLVSTSAAAITSLTVAWLDESDAAVTTSGSVIMSEYSGVGTLVDSVTASEMSDGGLPTAISATGSGQLVIATGGAPVSNRTWAIDAEGVTPTQVGEYSGQQTANFHAYGYTTASGDVSIGWNRTAGSAAILGVVMAVYEEGEAGPTPLSVNAGADQSIYVGQTANVGAVAEGGTAPYTYAWTKVSGPAGSFLNANQASTTFTPSGGAGTYVLRCIATDSTSTTAQDDLTLTVSQAPALVTVASVNDATGWTPTGGTVLQVLSDTSDSTLVTSQENPTEQVLDVVMGPAVVAEGQHWTQRVRMRRSSSSTSGTATGYLYVGSTLISTATGKTIPGSLGDVDFTFPNADVSAITAQQWTDGVRFVVEVTAA